MRSVGIRFILGIWPNASSIPKKSVIPADSPESNWRGNIQTLESHEKSNKLLSFIFEI